MALSWEPHTPQEPRSRPQRSSRTVHTARYIQIAEDTFRSLCASLRANELAGAAAASAFEAAAGLDVATSTQGKSLKELRCIVARSGGEANSTEAKLRASDTLEKVEEAQDLLESIHSISHKILDALGLLAAEGQVAHLESLSIDALEADLSAAGLQGLCDVLAETLGLQQPAVQTAAELNEKFQLEALYPFSFGNVQTFFGGITALVGPPLLIGGSLLKSMGYEHCQGPDSTGPDSSLSEHEKFEQDKFTSKNGVTTTSAVEWEFVYCPVEGKAYPDRFPVGDERRRKPRNEAMLTALLQAKNSQLTSAGQEPLIEAELVAGILYTGPMYEKYNLVLRAKSGSGAMVAKWRDVCNKNKYPTTIHCINSCIVKLSKLTKACKLWRGTIDASLPDTFFVPDEFNIRGGIEFGFTSMTTDKKQALHYAKGNAATLFEAEMGLIDRGASMSEISQYPFEAEIVFPPLLGIEVKGNTARGGLLLMDIRLSLNLMSETVEQVLRRRYKTICDTCDSMVFELLQDSQQHHPNAPGPASELARVALECGPRSCEPAWLNNDQQFLKAVNTCVEIKEAASAMIDLTDDALMRRMQQGWDSVLPSVAFLDLGSKVSIWLESWQEIFRKLTALQRLKMDRCTMERLPESFGTTFIALQSLNLDLCTELVALPETFGQLKALHTLEMSGDYSNQMALESLPTSLGNLAALQTLKLGFCVQLVVLPNSFGRLKKLQTLSMESCEALLALPESFGDLEDLQVLKLESCIQLAALPASFGQLKKLQTLSMVRCHALQELPASFGGLEELQVLELDHCRELAALLASFGQLKKLQVLSMTYCTTLQELPKSFGDLEELQVLKLDRCRDLGALPDSLGQLKKLQTLSMTYCNALRELPISFGDLDELQLLTLDHCRNLAALPDSFGQLKKLHTLSMTYCNALQSLPPSFGDLEELQVLKLDRCIKLAALPSSFGQLKLQTLSTVNCFALYRGQRG